MAYANGLTQTDNVRPDGRLRRFERLRRTRSARWPGADRSWPLWVALTTLGAVWPALASSVPQCEMAQVRYLEALAQSDDRAVETVRSSVDLCTEFLDRWLFEAARWRAPQTATLLLDRGASARARDVAGWTPLHHALANGPADDDDDQSRSRQTKLTQLLLSQNADVNATTDVVAWTALHLAVGGATTTLVEILLDRGADPSARTHVGGWTPLFIASEQRADPAVTAALKRAGATSPNDTDVPIPILSTNLSRYASGTQSLFAIPTGAGGSFVQGSFTRAAAKERLVFERLGLASNERYLTAVGLVDHLGVKKLSWISDQTQHFLGLCRDPVTSLDHVMMEQWAEGNCCADELEFWSYDEDIGTMRRVYSFENLYGEPEFDYRLSSAWPDAAGHCRWRQREAASDTFARALETLQVGGLPTFSETGPIAFPTRSIANTTAEPLVTAVRGMPPDVAKTRNVLDVRVPLVAHPESDDDYDRRLIDSDRWEIVAITGTGRGADSHMRSDEATLVHDRVKREWYSILDCTDLEAWDLRHDILFGRFRDTSGGCGQGDGLWFKVSIDLNTRKVRLLDSTRPGGPDSALRPRPIGLPHRHRISDAAAHRPHPTPAADIHSMANGTSTCSRARRTARRPAHGAAP